MPTAVPAAGRSFRCAPYASDARSKLRSHMKQRSYQVESDVALLQAFNAAAITATGGCGYLHPGDIPHRLFNGNKLFDPGDVLAIWEDAAGVAAWVLVGPRHHSFDAQVRPDLRASDFERAVLEFAAQRTLTLMRDHAIASERIYCDAFRCDTARVDLLAALGWTPVDEPPYVVNRRALVDLAEPVLPDGYTIRAVIGPDEAAALAAVHAASFGSIWTPEQYRKVMLSPGYAAEREFVVAAADGTLAAFTVTWHDPVNHTGLFEPVGTHRDHRRRGLGRALLLYAMRQMVAAGMRWAIVANEGSNPAARALYHACGFRPWHLLDSFVKPATSDV